MSSKNSTTKKISNNNDKKNDKVKSKSSTEKKPLNIFLDKLKIILKKILIVILKFLKKHWQLIVMNIVIFILTVFIESQYIHKLKLLLWFSNTILFIVIPTIIFTIKFKIKSKDIVLSIPMLYVLFLIFLDYCTLRELYGISSLGLDKIPNYVDAIMVVFVFTLFEYIPAFIINKIMNKNKVDKKVKTINKKS